MRFCDESQMRCEAAPRIDHALRGVNGDTARRPCYARGMRDLAFAICALLAFLLPIGFYCLILATMNRRSRPLMVSGVWDAIGLLFAVAGFFVVTAPMLLSEFFVRVYDLDSNGWFGLWLSQWLVWLVYFL